MITLFAVFLWAFIATWYALLLLPELGEISRRVIAMVYALLVAAWIEPTLVLCFFRELLESLLGV